MRSCITTAVFLGIVVAGVTGRENVPPPNVTLMPARRGDCQDQCGQLFSAGQEAKDPTFTEECSKFQATYTPSKWVKPAYKVFERTRTVPLRPVVTMCNEHPHGDPLHLGIIMSSACSCIGITSTATSSEPFFATETAKHVEIRSNEASLEAVEPSQIKFAQFVFGKQAVAPFGADTGVEEKTIADPVLAPDVHAPQMSSSLLETSTCLSLFRQLRSAASDLFSYISRLPNPYPSNIGGIPKVVNTLEKRGRKCKDACAKAFAPQTSNAAYGFFSNMCSNLMTTTIMTTDATSVSSTISSHTPHPTIDFEFPDACYRKDWNAGFKAVTSACSCQGHSLTVVTSPKPGPTYRPDLGLGIPDQPGWLGPDVLRAMSHFYVRAIFGNGTVKWLHTQRTENERETGMTFGAQTNATIFTLNQANIYHQIQIAYGYEQPEEYGIAYFDTSRDSRDLLNGEQEVLFISPFSQYARNGRFQSLTFVFDRERFPDTPNAKFSVNHQAEGYMPKVCHRQNNLCFIKEGDYTGPNSSEYLLLEIVHLEPPAKPFSSVGDYRKGLTKDVPPTRTLPTPTAKPVDPSHPSPTSSKSPSPPSHLKCNDIRNLNSRTGSSLVDAYENADLRPTFELMTLEY